MSALKKILLIDDDNDLRQSLAEQFNLYDEFNTTECATGNSGLETVKSNNFDIVILDVGLPDFDGREVCRMIRQVGIKIPVIMLTGADTDADTILGLDSGANDYVTKPFKFPVLLARIRAQLRQHQETEGAIFNIGPYVFVPSNKMLTDEAENIKIRLTEKETAILKYLLRASGKPVKREQLLDEVWGYNAGVTTHTLETHIYRLRQKIEKDPSSAKIINTETGGYSLNA